MCGIVGFIGEQPGSADSFGRAFKAGVQRV